MFFHQQLCSPGTLIWPSVTWTRSFGCSRPNTLLGSQHRSKVSPLSKHKLSLSSLPVAWRRRCDGSLEERLQGYDFNICPTWEPLVVGPQPPHKQGFCRRADLGHSQGGLAGTFPPTQLIPTSQQFGLIPEVWKKQSDLCVLASSHTLLCKE